MVYVDDIMVDYARTPGWWRIESATYADITDTDRNEAAG